MMPAKLFRVVSTGRQKTKQKNSVKLKITKQNISPMFPQMLWVNDSFL